MLLVSSSKLLLLLVVVEVVVETMEVVVEVVVVVVVVVVEVGVAAVVIPFATIYLLLSVRCQHYSFEEYEVVQQFYLPLMNTLIAPWVLFSLSR